MHKRNIFKGLLISSAVLGILVATNPNHIIRTHSHTLIENVQARRVATPKALRGNWYGTDGYWKYKLIISRHSTTLKNLSCYNPHASIKRIHHRYKREKRAAIKDGEDLPDNSEGELNNYTMNFTSTRFTHKRNQYKINLKEHDYGVDGHQDANLHFIKKNRNHIIIRNGMDINLPKNMNFYKGYNIYKKYSKKNKHQRHHSKFLKNHRNIQKVNTHSKQYRSGYYWGKLFVNDIYQSGDGINPDVYEIVKNKANNNFVQGFYKGYSEYGNHLWHKDRKNLNLTIPPHRTLRDVKKLVTSVKAYLRGNKSAKYQIGPNNDSGSVGSTIAYCVKEAQSL